MRNTFLVLSLLSQILTGCGQDHAQRNPLPSVNVLNPTSVVITRQKHRNLNALTVTIRDSGKARQLYIDLRSSGLFPSGTFNCPADFGVDYALTFKSGNKVELTAYADPSGCRVIQLSTGQTLWGAESFWTQLAKLLGFPNVRSLVEVHS